MLRRALMNLSYVCKWVCVCAPVEWEWQQFSASSCALQAAILSHSFSSVRNSCQVPHNVFQTVRGHGLVPYICVCMYDCLCACMYAPALHNLAEVRREYFIRDDCLMGIYQC